MLPFKSHNPVRCFVTGSPTSEQCNESFVLSSKSILLAYAALVSGPAARSPRCRSKMMTIPKAMT